MKTIIKLNHTRTAQKLKNIREASEYSLESLSKATKLSIRTLHELEQGTYTLSVEQLVTFANLYGLKPSELIVTES